ncbi:glycerol-3-phosphate O-acyltransferase, partial [Aureobasidium melanogenum]
MAPSSRKTTSDFWANLVYDAWLWTFSVLVDLFFREVHPRSSWKVPRNGPVIIVAAPHANQFVDPLILMRVLRRDAFRRVCFLIAEKSMKRKFIGWGARMVGSVPVGRALDLKKPAKGKIYLPDPEGDPTLIKGVDTDFENKEIYMVGGVLALPSFKNKFANTEIKEILGPNEIRLKKPFSGNVALRQLTGQEIKDEKADAKLTEGFEGTNFEIAPHVDQGEVYSAVFQKLHDGGCIGIFPEGGSHDRTELLPLKAGVAIMALGALAEDPNCGVKIVPCGMNYFHAHKFRSRAVVEFGTPVEIPNELVEMYKNGQKREAVGQVLETVYQALVSVTVTSPDYDTLMLIQAVRRLYNPKGKKLPLPMVVELNRRLVKGYTTYKDDPRIINLKKAILAYNKELMMLNIRDHQVSYAKFSIFKVIVTLFYRLGKLLVLAVAVLPGLVLFGPVFITGKVYSIKKSREALAASTVKIQGRDVMATWKLLVSMVVAPLLYNFYNIILAIWTHYNRIGGRVPEWVPLWAVFAFGYVLFPAITFAALRFGEVGMDIVKSLRPLILSLGPSSGNTLVKLRAQRASLVEQVTEVINELGPELYPDFDHQRIVSDPNHPLSPQYSQPQTPRSRRSSEYERMSMTSPDLAGYFSRTGTAGASIGGGSGQNSTHLPRNESFGNIGGFGFFSSRPHTPNRSRSRNRSRTSSDGGMGLTAMKPMTTIDSKGGYEQVTEKIRDAMKQRGRRRRSEDASAIDGWEMADADVEVEDDEDKKDI